MNPVRWNAWNEEHIDRHNVSREEAEQVIRQARRPFPRYQGDGRWLVRGQTASGFYLQVVFIYSPAEVIYVIHARPLTDNEKRQLGRRRK
jgi:uncharacterized DUF497 family protein